MATALGTVNHVKVLQREVEAAGQSFNACPQCTFWQRRELVEQRLDKNGVYDDKDELRGDPTCRMSICGIVTLPLNELTGMS